MILIWLLVWLVACESRQQDRLVFIEVDGNLEQHRTQMLTVQQVLSEVELTLGPLDRVQPDLNFPLERSTRIIITRVREQTLSEQRVLPFKRQILRDEALPDGEARVIQLGVNGREELTYRLRFENDKEVSRELEKQITTIIPRSEIIVQGAKGLLKSAKFKGTIIYLSNNNGWIMRETTSEKRPLTFTGDLDGRVFAISPNNNRMLFSRRASVGGAIGAVGPLNSLWYVDTRIVGESATRLPLEDVLYADWVSDNQIIYSTGERTSGAPGWKAHNDLWLLDLPTQNKTRVMEPLTHFAYAYWGLSFALSPNNQRLAYTSADEIGFIEIPSGKRSVLQKFPVYQTDAGWVWTPDVSWSADARFIAATLHAPPPGTPNPERAQLFDVWAINANGSFAAQVAPTTGMFANPVWSRQGRIAYAQAYKPEQSADTQYDVYVMDADGSDKLRVFPQQGERGLTNPQFVWSSDGAQILIVQDGNLYLIEANGRGVTQLTADGGGSHPRWR